MEFDEQIYLELVTLNEKTQNLIEINESKIELLEAVFSSWALPVTAIQYYLLIIVPAILMFTLMWWGIKQFLYR